MGFRNTTSDPVQSLCTIPAAVAAYVTVEGDAPGALRTLKITANDVPITITDSLAYGSVKLLTLPAGVVNVLGCTVPTITPTTTSATTTLNASSTLTWGLGSAAASNVTLATTMINFCPGSGVTPGAATSSATANVAGSGTANFLSVATGTILDGTSTAIPVYLNFAVPTGGDIDADATITVDLVAYLTVLLAGDI